MKTIQRILAVAMIVVMLVSVVSVTAYAADIIFTSSSFGGAYLVPTNSKYNKELDTVYLYGDYDYLFLKGKAGAKGIYLFYEICSDEEGTDVIDSGYETVSNGGFKAPRKIKLKGKYSSKTYYMFTYAAYFDEDGNAIVSVESFRQFKVKVDRNPSFKKNVVVLRSTSNTCNGPQVNWYKVNGASKYYIYRRAETSTKWKRVGTVSGSKTSFTDTSLKKKNGDYRYTVKAINKKGDTTRYLNSGIINNFARTPVMKSIAVKYNNGIEIKWGKTSSKAKYDIYRKTGSGDWKKIKSNYTGTTYTDTSVKSGKKYTYTVRAKVPAYFGTATSAYYSNSDKAVTYLRMPTLKDAVAVENGINISWYIVSGAKGYTILRKNSDGSTGWSSVGKVGANATSFIDTSANIETGYVYSVRSEAANNKGSYNRTGIEYIYVAPEIPDVTDPDVTVPDVTDPDVTVPDVTNPDVTESTTEPETTNPDITESTTEPVTEPETTNPAA